MPVLPDGNRPGRNPLPPLHQPALIRPFLIGGLLLSCAPADERQAEAAQNRPAGLECTVSRIADGDSFYCGATGRVRLLMIDAPELSQGTSGRRSMDALLQLVPVGTEVRIETDVRPRDDYGRILGYVYLGDGRMVNEEMARSGFATTLVYPPNVRHAERIRSAVDDARKARRGLWATNFFDCSPRDHRAGRCPDGRSRKR
jgi:micrococcal nuclease